MIILRDEFAENPREWDNLAKMYCWHRNYHIGDANPYKTEKEFLDSADYKNAYVILPIYLLDHSGLAVSNESFVGRSLHAQWDSGQIGFVFATKEDLKSNGYVPKEENKKQIEDILKAETAIFNDYLCGNIYAYKIELDDEEVINHGNFYGQDINMVLQEMKDDCNPDYHLLFDTMQHSAKKLHDIME